MANYNNGKVWTEPLKQRSYSLIYNSANYASREAILQPSLKDTWNSKDRLMFIKQISQPGVQKKKGMILEL